MHRKDMHQIMKNVIEHTNYLDFKCKITPKNRTIRYNVFLIYFIAILALPVIESSAIPSFIWPLAYIYNHTVPVTPPMTVHGGVTQVNETGLSFNGIDGWIDAGDFTDQCIANPSVCTNGLSLGLRIHLDEDQFTAQKRKYIFDSGGHDGNGVSIFTENNQIFAEIATSGTLWKTSSFIDPKRWHFLLITWSKDHGLLLFVDGPLFAKSYVKSSVAKNVVYNNHIILGRINSAPYDETFGKFNIEMISIFNEFVPNGRVFMSYSFSPPGQAKGNIRYVNARFMNKATFDIRIFPDRGLRKSKGYQVAKKSSTLLEFVLKEGPLPYGMDFLVRRNDSNTVVQLRNKDWVHIDASDDAQVIAEITIGQDEIKSLIFTTKGVVPHFNTDKTLKIQNGTKEGQQQKLPFASPPPILTTIKKVGPEAETTSTIPITTTTTTTTTNMAAHSSTPAVFPKQNMSSFLRTTPHPVSTGSPQNFLSTKVAEKIIEANHISQLASKNSNNNTISTTYMPSLSIINSTITPNINSPTSVTTTVYQPVEIDKEDLSPIDQTIKNIYNEIIDNSTSLNNNTTLNIPTIHVDAINSSVTNISANRNELNGHTSNTQQNTSQKVEYIAGLTNETCKFCGKDEFVVSTEKNKNELFVEKLNVLSAIQGSLNTSTSNNSILPTNTSNVHPTQMINNTTPDHISSWSKPEEGNITSSNNNNAENIPPLLNQNISTTASPFLFYTTTTTPSVDSLKTTIPPSLQTTSSTQNGWWSTTNTSIDQPPNLNIPIDNIPSTLPINQTSLPILNPPTINQPGQEPTNNKLPPSELPIYDTVAPPINQAINNLNKPPTNISTPPVVNNTVNQNNIQDLNEYGKPLSETGQMGSTNHNPLPGNQLTTERPMIGPEIIKINTQIKTTSATTSSPFFSSTRAPLFTTTTSNIPIELSQSKINNGGINANAKVQYQLGGDCGNVICPIAKTTAAPPLFVINPAVPVPSIPVIQTTTAPVPPIPVIQTTATPITTTSTSSTALPSPVTDKPHTPKATTKPVRRKTTKPFSRVPTWSALVSTTPMTTKYITNPSPTAVTTTLKKTPTKSKPHIKYPTPRMNYCCNVTTGVVKPIPTPKQQQQQQAGYQVDIFDVYKLPADGTRIDQGMTLTMGDCIGKPNCPPVPECSKLPKCNSTLVGMEFKGKLLGKMDLSMLINNGKNLQLQKQEMNLNQANANIKIQNNPMLGVIPPNNFNSQTQNQLFNPMVQNQVFNPLYPIPPPAYMAYPYNQQPNNVPYLNYMNSQGNIMNNQGKNMNNFGALGSPQVFNWKDAYLRSRSKNVNKGSNMKDEMMDDEVLSSIKDVSGSKSGGNFIYMSDNPKLDNLSPSKLWKNSMLITINKGLPIMTSAHLIPDQNNLKEKHLPLVGSTETLSGHPGLTLLLTDIENNTIKSSPLLIPHGTIHRWQGGLKFDGKTAWVDLNTINATFLNDPSVATNGFALGFKIMLDSSIRKIERPAYVLDGGGGLGRGVSVFISHGKIFCIVATQNNLWQVNSTLVVDEWIYIMFTWHPTSGLTLYINGMKESEENRFIHSGSTDIKLNDVVIGANQKKERSSFLLMYLASIDLVFKLIDEKDAIEFAPPIANSNYVLTFSSVEADHLRNHLKMKMHGTIKENRGTLVFDGVHSFLHDTGEFSDTYIMMPSINPAGLTICVKFKFDRNLVQSPDEKFILDTGGWLGHGVSLFVHEGQLTAVVGSKGYVWVVQTVETAYTSWCFVIITWREDMGIYLYLNGALVGKEKTYKYLIDEYSAFDGLTIGCSVLKNAQSFGRFNLAMMSFFPSYTTIDELMKFSPPLVLRPTFDWFFMLIQHNATLTSPQLKVVGDVKATDEGLLFDGKSSYLNAGSLEDASDENGEIICEHYEKKISCPNGQLLKITYANYGRLSEIPCQGKRKYITTNCKSRKSLFLAKTECDNKVSCNIKALNSQWGNACPGVIKYMDIRYQCIGTIKQNGSNTNISNGAHFITNPFLTSKGLTIATKIRINKDAANYKNPRYIVDSGGSHGNGISIYITDQMLYCQVSTLDKSWRVNTELVTDDWLYIVMTWNQMQGLVLYVNGILSNITSKPMINEVTDITSPGILLIGRSVSNENNTYAKFQMTLFTVLKTYTSRSESFRLFAYYVGRAITNAFEVAAISKDTVLICEYETRTITCPPDQVIEMVYANYGRTSTRPCAWGTHHDTNCTLPTAINTAREHCNDKNSCELIAKNSMWKTNPCPGIIKYVEVKYICNEVTPNRMISSKYIGDEDPNSLVIP